MRRRKEQRAQSGGALTGLFMTLLLFSGAVVLVLNLRWLYYLDIVLLDIEKLSGMKVAQIRANYDALIAYNSIFFRGSLQFPTLAMSEHGRIHFAEVKRIFDVIQIVFGISLAGSIYGAFCMRRSGSRRHLRIAGTLSLIIPVVLGILALAGWDRFFVTFHQIFFRNDYWLFDPAQDPVIRILPDTYFLHCAAGILLVIFAGGIWMLRKGRNRT